jgi:hypothetical protein
LSNSLREIDDLDEVGKAIIDLNGLPLCIKTGGIELRHIVKIAKGCVGFGYEWHLLEVYRAPFNAVGT